MQVSFFGFGALALLWLPPWLARAPETGRLTDGLNVEKQGKTHGFSPPGGPPIRSFIMFQPLQTHSFLAAKN
jgi:hypothetical protein